jgi:NAD(P)-dependent dehydrogenase (short-subunit alcohol dehydrogenase family)
MSSSQRALNIIVTGATGEIGRAIAKSLAEQGHNLILPVRNITKGNKLAESIKSSTGNNNVHIEHIELDNYKSIRSFIDNYAKKYKSLDVLLNDAAISPPQTRAETSDGIEAQFGVNVLAYHVLSKYLRPLLKRDSAMDFTRIINVASNYAGDLDVTDLQFVRRRYDNNAAYRQSKQADRMIAVAAANQYKNDYIGVYSCHPGVVTSSLLSGLGMSRGYESAAEGAETPAFLATSDQVSFNQSGSFWDKKQLKKDHFASESEKIQQLWDYLEELDHKLAAKL